MADTVDAHSLHLAEERLEHLWGDKPGLLGWLSTVDHKKIGKRYLVTAMAFLIVGGIEALVMRIQLARPNAGVLQPEAYDQVFTMHGMTMIFWYASPILSGFGNYLIPLMIGARDMAYPRLNAFSFWTFLFSGLFLYIAPLLGQAPHDGWFNYVPYASTHFSPGLGEDFYCLSLIFLTISTTVGAINFITTILRMRAPGMTIGKMPLMLWSTMTVSFVILFALPALTVACTCLELDRQWGFHFFDVASGGSAMAWQHLFWFFGHPWVYVVFLPATGMISVLLPTYCRRPIVGYRWVAFSTVMTGVVGFSVWVHHMFSTSDNHAAMTYFSAASMVISIFTIIQVFAWLATMVRGRVVLATPMYFALGFIALLVVGGLTGVASAFIPLDWQITDTYFIVGHIHYVLVGANVFPVFAAFYHWLPKITGVRLDERLGKWSFWLMFLGFNALFFPMHILGLLGMPRRIYTYAADTGWGGLNTFETIGAVVLGFGMLVSFVNLAIAYMRRQPAGKSPWHADTLEWSTESPPASYGSEHIPTVVTSNPLWDDHDEEEDPHGARILDHGRYTYSTSARWAEPLGLALMPKESLLPFVMGLVFSGWFLAILLKSLLAVAIVSGIGLLAMAAWHWPRREKKPEPPIGPDEPRHLLVANLDRHRGTWGMWQFIATEAMLFVCLFFVYFYLRAHNDAWPLDEPPALKFAIPMLIILLTSSVVLYIGERFEKHGEDRLAKLLLAGTIALGGVFLVLQIVEYSEHLAKLLPTDDAYASIFYTITTFHMLHLVVGLSMLIYALAVPRRDDTQRPPHRVLHNVAMYWHFVDLVWVFIVVLLYFFPQVS